MKLLTHHSAVLKPAQGESYHQPCAAEASEGSFPLVNLALLQPIWLMSTINHYSHPNSTHTFMGAL